MANRRSAAVPLFPQAEATRRAPVVMAPAPVDVGVLPSWTFPRLSMAFVGVALFLVVIHSYRLSIGQIAIVLGLFGIILERGKFRLPASFIWCLVFFAWAVFSTSMSTAFELNRPDVRYQFNWEPIQELGKVLIISIVVANALRDRSQVSGFLLLWLGCFALWPVRGTLMNAAFGIGGFGRYAWNFIFENPNDLAGIILLMLGLTLAAAQAGGKQIRLLAYIGTGILVLIVFLTQSRGAFLGLMVGAAVAITVRRKRLRGLFGAGALAALVLVAAPESVWDRLGGMKALTSSSTIQQADGERSAESRWAIWGVATRIFSDNPITGVGFGAYPLVHYSYAIRTPGIKVGAVGRKDTHSTYLNALAETGIVGFTALMGMLIGFGHFLATCARRLRRTAPARAEQFKYLLAAWVAFWVASLFATYHRIVFPYLFMGFVTTLAAQYGVLGKQSAPAADSPQPAPAATRRRTVQA